MNVLIKDSNPGPAQLILFVQMATIQLISVFSQIKRDVISVLQCFFDFGINTELRFGLKNWKRNHIAYNLTKK